MRRDRRGLAGLFDALIFLAIASLVSVSLLSALGGQQPHREVGSERTDIVHEVLLRSTVADVRGNPVTIEEAFKLGASGERYGGNISMVLDLLLPGSGWQWTVETSSRSYAFGSEAVTSGPVYCSVVRAPIDGGEVVFRLQVWDQS
jgi:hypothetical protein